jgi:hypothetical protein
MQWLRRFFALAPAVAPASEHELPLPSVDMIWEADTTYPVPDWSALREAAPHQTEAAARHAYYTAAARAWLNAMLAQLGENFGIAASPNFLLLSDLTARENELALQYCERTRSRILGGLPGIAAATGHGPHVALIFANQEQYYDYVGNYYPEKGAFALSSGMFLCAGYGHFVFVANDLSRMELVIAHELTHCLVMHLPIPAWLNEGIAVSTEKRLHPAWYQPGQGLYSEKELARKHAAFWNAQTIQEFWSGKSFKRPDEGNLLSYDLGERLTRLAASDYALFTRFVTAAERTDGGAASARAHLGVALSDLAAAVLGDGDWTPQPACWREGTEAGQFA